MCQLGVGYVSVSRTSTSSKASCSIRARIALEFSDSDLPIPCHRIRHATALDETYKFDRDKPISGPISLPRRTSIPPRNNDLLRRSPTRAEQGLCGPPVLMLALVVKRLRVLHNISRESEGRKRDRRV